MPGRPAGGDIPSVIAAYPNTKDGACPTYRAELASLCNGLTVMSDHPGYIDTGFVDNFVTTNCGVSVTVNAVAVGDYTVTLRDGNGGSWPPGGSLLKRLGTRGRPCRSL